MEGRSWEEEASNSEENSCLNSLRLWYNETLDGVPLKMGKLGGGSG